ncbi:MAG: UDP-N-acetylmuramate--L-alanine ligase [Thermoanaerobaculia bacterium]
MNFGHIKSIHFVGIGGIGMSGLAEILTNYDFRISGCDLKLSSTTERLRKRGIAVTASHDPAHLTGADLVVISSAVRPGNRELEEARSRRIPVVRRAEMLGEITRLKQSVAISGTHGKTTTSAMTALVLAEAGLDPTLIVGGVLRNYDTNARLGAGELLVVEADEYDRSFLYLYPTYAVVTNIESDHLDYYGDLDEIRGAFADFARRVPFFGMIAGCVDDANVASLLDAQPRRTVGYGLGPAASLRATEIVFDERGASFDVTRDGKRLGRVELHVPGEHNIRNSLAALAIGLELDIPFETIVAALGRFSGVERRFQLIGECNGAIVVDDYAHHPTEIRATLEAARGSYPDRRIVALFQPHLYSRTRDFFEDFSSALEVADAAYVTPIYPAREEPIAGVTAELITDAAARRGATHVTLLDRDADTLADFFRETLGPGDLFVTMGAGDINRVGFELAGVKA